MKKIITIIAIVALVSICALSMVGCGSSVVIGVQSGTTGYSYVTGDADWGFDGFSNAECSQYNSGALAVADMLNGNVDYIIIDDGPAKDLAAANDGIKVIDIALTTEEYGIGVDPAQTELLTGINEALAAMVEDGTLADIFDRYENSGEVETIYSATKDLNNKDGQLVIATNAAFAPYEYTNGTGFSGIDMEIAAYLADYLDLELVIENMEFESVVTSVGINGIDIALSGLTINAARAEVITFSDAYYAGAAQVLIVPADDTTFDDCTTAEEIIAILSSL